MLIHFKTTVAGRLLQDSFLWPREEQDLLQIKFFAANLLADVFGREFGALDPREIECKYNSFKGFISPVFLSLTDNHILSSFHLQLGIRNPERARFDKTPKSELAAPCLGRSTE